LTAVGLLGVYLASWYEVMRSPLSLESEGPSLWAALELAKGHNIYDAKHLVEAPWAVTIYTPLFFVLGAPFQLTTGDFNYWGLRLVSLISFVFAMFCFHRLLSLYSSNRLSVTIGMVLFASYVTVWWGSFKARVDMLALSFSIASLYFLVNALKKEPAEGLSARDFADSAKRLSLSALLVVAAIYSKLSSIVVVPAVCIYLLSRRRFADMLYYLVSTATVSAILLFVINGVTGGGFLKHITFAANVPFSMYELQKHLEMLGVDWPKLCIVPLFGFAWFAKVKDRDRLILPLWLAIFSGALTMYTVGTMHANLNHGLLFYFALSWLTVVFLEAYPLSLGGTTVLASALCTYILATQIPTMFSIKERMDKSLIQVRRLQVQDKVVFVEDPALAIVCGATPLFVDVATFLQVWDRDKRSLAELEQGLRERKYPAVIINLNDSLRNKPEFFWPDAILKAIDENYNKSDYVAGNGDLQQMYVVKEQ